MLAYREMAQEIPPETAHYARASYPKGNPYMKMRDEMGVVFTNETFAELFEKRGRPSLPPGMLALVSIMQYMEGLSDRQAADAVKGRLDWKYALGLELDSSGFSYTVLRDFRQRLLKGGAEEKLLNHLLELFQAKSLLKSRGVQRTDATHVLAATRNLNQLEMVGETMRAVLNQLATVAGSWLLTIVSKEWHDRYGARIEAYRLPKQKQERHELGLAIGADGQFLLEAIYAPDVPSFLRQLPIVDLFRRIWIQQFCVVNGQLEWRKADNRPAGAHLIQTPYDEDARHGSKRQVGWTGYKVHLTETCDPALPIVVTNVQTSTATEPDVKAVDAIHTSLQSKGLRPDTHLVDAGYISTPNLIAATDEHHIQLHGPAPLDMTWQAQTEGAFDRSQFHIDWQTQQVTCPQGHTNSVWSESLDSRGHQVIQVRFNSQDCLACDARSSCTRSQTAARSLKLQAQIQHNALEQARARQKTDAFKQRYKARSGIEGSLSLGVRAFDLRRCRYIGHAKAHLQNIFVACALNLSRVIAFWQHRQPSVTRTSAFAALVAVSD